jgi:nitrite reductase/ring-hydroxylating ferredoxin subunit
MPTRRDFYRFGSVVLSGLITLGLALPGVAYVLDPLRRKSRDGAKRELTRLSGLHVGVPKSFAIIDERTDAWVKYPPEPVGSVWLIRQPEGSDPQVIAFTGTCPHLGCSISLGDDKKSFVCRCHMAKFNLKGDAANPVPPRPMDTLEVELTEDDDPAVVVRFARFRTQSKEKIPLG